MKNNKHSQNTSLRLMTVHEDFNHLETAQSMSLQELARTLEMIYEIERLNEELVKLEMEDIRNKYELN